MANTDQAFAGALVAVGVQTAFGVPNAGIAALTGSGTWDETDGFVLGDKGSGDADSGITLPTIEAVFREVAPVAGSFTESADAYQKPNITGFSFSFALQGNGATSTPAAGEADLATLLPGIEAILETAGFIGGNGGTAPEVDYTPRTASSTGGAGMDGPTVYSTWKVWHGDLAMLFSDCLIENMTFEFTPGGNCIVSCDVLVGTFDPDTYLYDGISPFPTVTFGPQTANAAPTVEGVAFVWGQTHGFTDLTIAVRNTIETAGDSNVAVTGTRQTQTRREIEVTGTIYVETADSSFHVDRVVSTSAPSDALSFTVGTPATGAPQTINAFRIEIPKLQAQGVKYNRVGTAMVAELTASKATGTTGGDEFVLVMT